MKRPSPIVVGGWSLAIPLALLASTRFFPVTEDGYGVDHWNIAHIITILALGCVMGLTCGVYASWRGSRWWWLTSALNAALLVFFIAGGNNF